MLDCSTLASRRPWKGPGRGSCIWVAGKRSPFVLPLAGADRGRGYDGLRARFIVVRVQHTTCYRSSRSTSPPQLTTHLLVGLDRSAHCPLMAAWVPRSTLIPATRLSATQPRGGSHLQSPSPYFTIATLLKFNSHK